MSTAARGAAGYLVASKRAEPVLARMQRAMDVIAASKAQIEAERAAEQLKRERERRLSTAARAAQRR